MIGEVAGALVFGHLTDRLAAGNFLGPLVLGRYFDHWGRRVMIPATYALSGILLVATGALFWAGKLDR